MPEHAIGPGGNAGQEGGEAQGVVRGVEKIQGGTLALAGCLSMLLVQAAMLGRREVRYTVLRGALRRCKGAHWRWQGA